ncbi:MAG: tRNA pseudouridine(13) synthase TruD [Planctomycetaceae bacterium]
MKVKRLPTDFIVEELIDLQPADGGGQFALYRLHKQGLSTLEAIEAIQRRWELPRDKISWGGLKDKHAVTVQFLTIHRGPRRGLEQQGLKLEFLGWVPYSFRTTNIVGNRFRIILRAISAEELERSLAALPEVQRCGLPNYFDDQRFGSLGASGEFIAEPWIRGDYERTLWLAMAEPNVFDKGQELKEKELLRDLWGQWPECKQALSRSHRRSIITFLADRPGDFKGAWCRVNKDLRSLWLSAFQSQLWNEMLANLIRSQTEESTRVEVPLKTGPLPFPCSLTDEQLAKLTVQKLPLPSARIRLEEIENTEVRGLLERSLAARQLELRQLRVKYPRDSFFSKGERPALVQVNNLEWTSSVDDLYPDQHQLQLTFDLPRGSYATILVKRITDAVGIAPSGRRLRGLTGDN